MKTLKTLLDLTRKTLNEEKYTGHAFVQDNKEFYEFYSNDYSNLSIINLTRAPNEVKVKLRNMLIMFLHTHGENEFSDESALISTSICFDVAKDFSGNQNGCVLISWLPSPERNFSIHSNLQGGGYCVIP